MRFYPPEAMADTCVSGLPDKAYQPLLLPFFEHFMTEGPFGSVLTQAFEGNEFGVFQHHMFIKQPVFLYARTQKPMLSINYMLLGTPVGKIPGLGDIQLQENTYQLFYVPASPLQVWFEAGDYHCIHISFTPDYLEKMVDRHVNLQQLLHYATYNSELLLPHEVGQIKLELQHLIDQLTQTKADKGETELHFKSVVLRLFLHYIRRHHGLNEAGESTVEQVKSYILSNLAENITLEQLSIDFGISISSLRRNFERKTGRSVARYLTECRMEKALELLNNTEHTVAEVSLLVGYTNSSGFSHAFTKFFGAPPKRRS